MSGIQTPAQHERREDRRHIGTARLLIDKARGVLAQVSQGSFQLHHAEARLIEAAAHLSRLPQEAPDEPEEGARM